MKNIVNKLRVSAPGCSRAHACPGTGIGTTVFIVKTWPNTRSSIDSYEKHLKIGTCKARQTMRARASARPACDELAGQFFILLCLTQAPVIRRLLATWRPWRA